MMYAQNKHTYIKVLREFTSYVLQLSQLFPVYTGRYLVNIFV